MSCRYARGLPQVLHPFRFRKRDQQAHPPPMSMRIYFYLKGDMQFDSLFTNFVVCNTIDLKTTRLSDLHVPWISIQMRLLFSALPKVELSALGMASS